MTPSSSDTTQHGRLASFAWIIFAYVLSLTAYCVTVWLLRDHGGFWAPLLGDVSATFVIFAFSVAFKNSSFYDAYWSVLPPVLGFTWMFWFGARPSTILIVALTSLWGLRLTFNWARGWEGLHHEDWRYVDLQRQTGKAYWVVSFLGIHFFPTAQVFMGCLPMYFVATSDAPLSALHWLGGAITLIAIAIEGIADQQLRRFVLTRQPGQILNTGLWAWSRHPNYFGEILFWWGLVVVSLGGSPPAWTALGATTISLMFVFISIPMLEKRSHARRAEYPQYCQKTSLLIPWPPG